MHLYTLIYPLVCVYTAVSEEEFPGAISHFNFRRALAAHFGKLEFDNEVDDLQAHRDRVQVRFNACICMFVFVCNISSCILFGRSLPLSLLRTIAQLL